MMTKNEKKIILSLGKIAIKQIHLSALLLTKIPDDQRAPFQKSQDQAEEELDKFLSLLESVWGDSEKN